MKLRFRFVFPLTLLAAACFSLAAAQNTPLIKSETTSAKNVEVFEALWSKVNERYFDPKFNGVDWAKLKDIYQPRVEKAASKEALLAVLRQMLGELKTSHLNVWMAVKEKQLEKRIGANFDSKLEWIRLDAGFDTRTIEGHQVVSKIENGSPAKAAGVQLGWILIAADGQAVSSNAWRRILLLREGRKIDYHFRDSRNAEHHLSMAADFIIVRYERVSRSLTSNIAYLKFDSFATSGTGKWIEEQLSQFKQASAVIIDLRGNSGGQVREVKSALGPFFAPDTDFGTFVERKGNYKEQKIKGRGPDAFAGKVMVLVDEASTSAAEIFTAVMQESGRGQIIGARTAGKVLNSLQFELPADFELLVPFRDYLTPKRTRLEGFGIKPDVEIELTIADVTSGRDRVLEEALRIQF